MGALFLYAAPRKPCAATWPEATEARASARATRLRFADGAILADILAAAAMRNAALLFRAGVIARFRRYGKGCDADQKAQDPQSHIIPPPWFYEREGSVVNRAASTPLRFDAASREDASPFLNGNNRQKLTRSSVKASISTKLGQARVNVKIIATYCSSLRFRDQITSWGSTTGRGCRFMQSRSR